MNCGQEPLLPASFRKPEKLVFYTVWLSFFWDTCVLLRASAPKLQLKTKGLSHKIL